MQPIPLWAPRSGSLRLKYPLFIQLGQEQGWDQIAAVFYGKIMGTMFSKRELTAVGEPVIHVYGAAAVAEFDWSFAASLRSNGALVHTEGRESQFYIKVPDKGWRLVHVHYSGPPVKAPDR